MFSTNPDQTQSVDLLPSIEDLDLEDASRQSYLEILEQIIAEGELIFTIPACDEDRFRKGMAVAKSRMLDHHKKAGIPSDRRKLTYNVLAQCERPGCNDIHVSLQEPSGVPILSTRKPSNSL
jgi:hypothetical protein